MRAKEFILEKRRRKKRSRSRGAAYGPGPYGVYGYLAGYSGEGGSEGVAESLDSPYSYHWEVGDFGDLNAYAQLSDNTVLDIEFVQINVDKAQWEVAFQRDGQIHKTGKGDEQRVFATVLSAIKEFIENKQPKEVFFSAVKSEVNPESRKRLYDRLVQKYAAALGYQASQSETSRETKYKLSRIREQGVAESSEYEREPLYHATLKAFEPSIMKSGLLPGGNLRMFDWSDSKYVYLSNYPDIAKDFVDPGVIEPDQAHEEQIFKLMKQGGVILKIDQNKLNRQLLSADPHFSTDADDGAETYIYSGVIPPSAIIGKQYFNINESKQGVAENFADGRNPGRKGLAKRVGVNCKQSVSKLRSIAAKSSGERQRMAHWCANMKSGKQK